MADRSEHSANLRLVSQARERDRHLEILRGDNPRRATVLAYQAGFDFGRRSEWKASRRWWFTCGACFGTAAGAAMAAACWVFYGVPVVL